ncbi:hypothetical protein E8E13_010062 [Curvularia kusanoi]|uniref:Uncharacterized protein n=1 Tax=Curvularia kusanoi TaxID=90978 RepID=A0A9P4TJI0_CURKU|nr:hypothetical protein E8E13_010062 [Curvularia kusanoi]
MEGIGAVANCLAIVSVAFQLSETCVKLYVFWESIEDAPLEIAAIKEDLQYLVSVFKRIETAAHPPGHCIAEGIRHCRMKIADLMSIVEIFHDGLHSDSRKKRLRTAFRAATHGKQLQRFRETLNDTKATLTLAMVSECISQPLTYNISADINMPPRYTTHSIINRVRQTPKTSPQLQLPSDRQTHKPTSLSGQSSPQPLPPISKNVAQNALVYFEDAMSKQASGNFSVQELMLNAISQTAVASFESTSLEVLAQDGYMMDECGQVRAKTFVYSKRLGYRVSHQASTFRTALGCLWVRKTVISVANEQTGNLGRSHTVTSVVFYPTRYLQLLGIRNGVEAVMASAGRNWLYNCRVIVTRAVPEDSLIFELCRAGETRAVQLLLEKGQGSVVDTSPKGWKPIHYAAMGGHRDLCAMLIRAGADKSALVYEGPTESVLSPISFYVSHSTNRNAEEKIAMLRLFCDCIDLSEADADGWLVHEWLKKAYATERKPISQNSITWLLTLTGKEEYVEFSARNVWSALQHGVRSVLNHGRFGNVLEQILDLSDKEYQNTSQRHLDSLGAWLALRVNGRVLLPMCLNAGVFLQMRGFDWVEDDMPHKQFLQALPNIYSAWCQSVIEAVEQVATYMKEDLEQYLSQLNMTRADFLDTISCANTSLRNLHRRQSKYHICTDCGDDYSSLDNGLVEPARIAIKECVTTGHSFDCKCRTLASVSSPRTSRNSPSYSGTCSRTDNDRSDDEDEDFYDAEPHLFDDADLDGLEAFSDISLMLYRAHGRSWIGSYAVGEKLCASCFLTRERYIGPDGLAADFPPMPDSFEGLRAKW